MNKNIKIEIHPIKRLYMIAENKNLKNTAAILCSSSSVNESKIQNIGYRLCLEFDDITDSKAASAFNSLLAEQIKLFVDSLSDNTDTLYVCCNSGESRSTAISAAIMRYLGHSDRTIWHNPHYHPNALVYKLQCKAFEIYVSNFELYIKRKASERAFRKAVRGK